MPRMFTLHPASLLAGVLLAGVAFLSMSQVQIPRPQPWGPPKQDIVNVFYGIPESPISTLPGQTLLIYTVPNDRWLTVTGAWADGGGSLWAEDLNGSLTSKGPAFGYGVWTAATSDAPLRTPQECGGAIGWVFRPGSHVVLQNIGGNGWTQNSYSLIGYLSRE